MDSETLSPTASSSRRHASLALVVAVVIAVVLVIVGNDLLDGVVPGALLSPIDVNAEALAFFAIVIVSISALESGATRWTRALAGVLLVGVVTTTGLGDEIGFPGAYLTLREPFVAGVVCLGYLSLPADRRRRPWPYVGLIAVVIAAELPISGWEGSLVARWIVIYAEAAGMVLLTAALFDWILPWPDDRRPVRWPAVGVYLGAVSVLAAALVIRNPDGVDHAVEVASGVFGHIELWLLRNLESCIAAIGLTIWFSIRRGSESISSIRETSAQAARPS